MTPEAAALVAYLVHHRSKGWMSAKDIAQASHWSLRKIRAVAASSLGEIVSAPGGERTEAANRLRSQAKRMTEKARAIERA
jgi:hypothetical protein